MRTAAEIKETGAAWVTEAELEWLCEQYGTALRLLNGVIDFGVHQWHTVVNDEPSLAAWLGLTREQYAAWAEGSAAKLVEREASSPAKEPRDG